MAQLNANRIVRYEPATGTFKTIAGMGGTHFNGGTVDTSVDEPGFPCLDKDGNLLFSSGGHRQIKRIPANQL
ncbi:hypothetical protein D3C78_1952210 [compost metagenome]